jgi:hypothetical protein
MPLKARRVAGVTDQQVDPAGAQRRPLGREDHAHPGLVEGIEVGEERRPIRDVGRVVQDHDVDAVEVLGDLPADVERGDRPLDQEVGEHALVRADGPVADDRDGRGALELRVQRRHLALDHLDVLERERQVAVGLEGDVVGAAGHAIDGVGAVAARGDGIEVGAEDGHLGASDAAAGRTVGHGPADRAEARVGELDVDGDRPAGDDVDGDLDGLVPQGGEPQGVLAGLQQQVVGAVLVGRRAGQPTDHLDVGGDRCTVGVGDGARHLAVLRREGMTDRADQQVGHRGLPVDVRAGPRGGGVGGQEHVVAVEGARLVADTAALAAGLVGAERRERDPVVVVEPGVVPTGQ